jgi:hypothetical protein
MQADSGRDPHVLYLHTVKDGSGDDRVACLLKVNVSALVKSKSSLG